MAPHFFSLPSGQRKSLPSLPLLCSLLILCNPSRGFRVTRAQARLRPSRRLSNQNEQFICHTCRDLCRRDCNMRTSLPCVLLVVFVGAALFVDCTAQSMFAPCTYTSADGSYFDLSPLTRSNALHDYTMADAAGNSYIINVLKSFKPTNNLPSSPVYLPATRFARTLWSCRPLASIWKRSSLLLPTKFAFYPPLDSYDAGPTLRRLLKETIATGSAS